MRPRHASPSLRRPRWSGVILHNVKDIPCPEPASLLGEFELMVLLTLLRLGPDAYGASLQRDIEARTGRQLSISAVYVTLARLEAKGLVQSRIGEPSPQRGGRRRKHVALLPAGHRAVARAYQRFQQVVNGLEPQLKAI